MNCILVKFLKDFHDIALSFIVVHIAAILYV